MAVPTARDRSVTMRVSGGERSLVRNGRAPEQVVSVLFDTGIEEWRRGWRSSTNSVPVREALVSASDLTRGATATTQVVPNGQLAYTVLGAPVDVDRVLTAVTDHLTGVDNADVHVIVDDVNPLLTDKGLTAAERFVTGLRDGLPESVGDITLGCSIGPNTDPGLASLLESVDVVEGSNPVVVESIKHLRQEDPTTFGYVRRHWAEAQRGIDACGRNYPQAKQIHATLSDAETTPRTLGATVSGLVRLGVLETWSETVGPTRYDLTAYRPERLWDVGVVFAASSSDSDDELTTPT